MAALPPAMRLGLYARLSRNATQFGHQRARPCRSFDRSTSIADSIESADESDARPWRSVAHGPLGRARHRCFRPDGPHNKLVRSAEPSTGSSVWFSGSDLTIRSGPHVGRPCEPVCPGSCVDKGPDSVENRGPMWTSGPPVRRKPTLRRGRSRRHPRRVGTGFELSTVVSTAAPPNERRPSTVTAVSSTGLRRTMTRRHPPRPHHDDGDDGSKIGMRYPRLMDPLARPDLDPRANGVAELHLGPRRARTASPSRVPAQATAFGVNPP